MTEKNLWHYSRQDLACQYLDVLDTGITNRMTLFAPRRMGKTEFLLFDLAPEADRRGYDLVYISLWDDVNAPHRAMLAALHTAMAWRSKRRSAIHAVLHAAVRKVKIDSMFGVGAELEFADEPQVPARNDLEELGQLLEQLSRRKKRLLLLLDEIQHLSTAKQFAPLSYSLRTTLDRLAPRVKVVFTGSSRTGIRAMFHDHAAPFYHFSDQMPFPNLGQTFIDFLAKVFRRVTKRNLDKEAMWQCFERLDYSPFYLRQVIKALIFDPELSPEQAYKDVLELIATENNYERRWNKLKPLDQQVYLTILDNEPLFTDRQLQHFGKAVGRGALPRSTVQRSVQRLIAARLISAGSRGEYINEAPGFAAWSKKTRR